MALYKNIIDERGISTKYHRIVKFIVDNEKKIVQVLIKNYSDTPFRNKEKEKETIKKDYLDSFNKLTRMVEENSNNNIDNEEYQSMNAKIIELTEYINSISDIQDNEIIYAVSESEEILEYVVDGNYSLTRIYNELKTLNRYQDSEDV